MSNSLNVYIGQYLRVQMPQEETEEPGWCEKCNRRIAYTSNDSYCSTCGTKSTSRAGVRYIHPSDLLLSIFDDEDMFSSTTSAEPQCELFMPNKQDQPGGFGVNFDETEQSIPAQDWSGDWLLFEARLRANGIVYERCFGIISYYN